MTKAEVLTPEFHAFANLLRNNPAKARAIALANVDYAAARRALARAEGRYDEERDDMPPREAVRTMLSASVERLP